MKIKIIFDDDTSKIIDVSPAIFLDWRFQWICWIDNKKYSIQAHTLDEETRQDILYVIEHIEKRKPKNLNQLLEQDLMEYDRQRVYKKDGLLRTNLFLQAQNDLAMIHFGLPLHQITSYNPPLFESIGIETSADSKNYANIIADNALIPYCVKHNCDTCPVFLESGVACADEGSVFQAFDKTFDEATEIAQEIFIDELLCLVEDFDELIEESINKIKNKKGARCV